MFLQEALCPNIWERRHYGPGMGSADGPRVSHISNHTFRLSISTQYQGVGKEGWGVAGRPCQYLSLSLDHRLKYSAVYRTVFFFLSYEFERSVKSALTTLPWTKPRSYRVAINIRGDLRDLTPQQAMIYHFSLFYTSPSLHMQLLATPTH